MLIFWGIAAVLVIATLALLLPPLLRPARGKLTDTRAEKLAIYRQQFAELELDKLGGVLDAQQYGQARSELEHRLLEETGDAVVTTASAKPYAADRRLAIILLLLLPIAAVLIYLKIGNPLVITHPSAPPAEASKTAADIEPILKSLHEKLEKDPGDGAGWSLLARAYAKLHRYAEAVPAFENALKAIPDDPQLLTDYAITLALANDRKLAGKPEALVKQALKIDPHQVKALMLAASAAFERKDYKAAIGFWERLQGELPTGSEAASSVAAALDEARALSNQKMPHPQ